MYILYILYFYAAISNLSFDTELICLYHIFLVVFRSATFSYAAKVSHLYFFFVHNL